MNLKNTIQKTINAVLTLFLPMECLGCKKENTYLCDDCFNKIKIKDKIEPFEHPLEYLDGIMSATDYDNKLIQSMIHYLKFRFIKELAEPLANLLIKFHHSTSAPECAPALLIIPVPLNKKRFLERGFNQAELIATIFADHFNYPLMTDLVVRYRYTPHQVGLKKKERLTNVKNSFKVTDFGKIKNQSIILIDDVVTTGSTLEEIAKVLKEAGAVEVWGLVVAKD